MCPDRAVSPDACVAEKAYSRFDEGILPDFYIRIDISGLGINNSDAVAHQRFGFTDSKDVFNVGEFNPVIDSEDLTRVLNRKCDDLFASLIKNLNEVGQQIFFLDVLVGQLVQVLQEFFS